jgi:GNAT superfamily N-acetyltransferase
LLLTLPPTEPLGIHHDTGAFRSGSDAFDTFLKRQARQEQERNVSVSFVLSDPRECRRILGCYTMSAYVVNLPETPEDTNKHRRVAGTLLSRLAVDTHYRGRGLGEHLLLDAVQRVLTASETLGTLLLVADAEDQQSAAFYRHFDFIPFPSHPLRLFLPVGTVYGLWRDRK